MKDSGQTNENSGEQEKVKGAILKASAAITLLQNPLQVEIRKTYKYRIYPDKTQQERLEEVLGICQKLYNAGLEEWRETYRLWRQRNKGIGYTLHDNGVAVRTCSRNRVTAKER